METITVGKIVNTHGLRGTLKVISYTDFIDERYKAGNRLYIAFKRELIPVTVKTVKTVKGIEYIEFEEFDDINQCERYKGCDLLFDKSGIHELDDDEFYFEELIGMTVLTDKPIGVCVDIRQVPQGELLEVRLEDGRVVLIPFRNEFVGDVVKATNTIQLIEWEGLL